MVFTYGKRARRNSCACEAFVSLLYLCPREARIVPAATKASSMLYEIRIGTTCLTYISRVIHLSFAVGLLSRAPQYRRRLES